jgi:hypothetical protein
MSHPAGRPWGGFVSHHCVWKAGELAGGPAWTPHAGCGSLTGSTCESGARDLHHSAAHASSTGTCRCWAGLFSLLCLHGPILRRLLSSRSPRPYEDAFFRVMLRRLTGCDIIVQVPMPLPRVWCNAGVYLTCSEFGVRPMEAWPTYQANGWTIEYLIWVSRRSAGLD